MLKIAFIPANVSGVVFYRAWQPHNAIQKSFSNVESIIWWFTPNQFTLHPWENEVYDSTKGPLIQRDIESAVAWADVVVWMVLHSPQSLNLFKYLRAKYDKQFITEVDDYLFSVPQKNAAHDFYKPGSDLARVGLEQIKSSDGLIVSTPYLKELYSPHNDKISVVENAIDLTLWRKHTPSPGRRRVVLGWVGGGGHEPDLEIIKEPLFEILEKNRHVTFSCVSGVPNFFKNHKKIEYTTDYRPIDKYPKWVHSKDFDIGLAPLVDNNFNRGKSNLRYLEYSALGIPTIASPVDHFIRTEKDKNILFASNAEEWKIQMQRLIDDVEERQSIGEKAYQDVKANWNVKNLGRKYLNAVEEIIDAKLNSFNTRVSDQGQNRGHERIGVGAFH